MKSVFVLIFAVFVSTVAAFANTDGDLLRKHGLVGKWAFTCALASSNENAHTVIEAPADSAPTERLTMGDYERVAVISEVTELDGDKLQWTQIGEKKHLIVKSIESGRMRTWMSTRADGEVLIRDGRFTSGGDVKWFYRCDADN